MPGLPAPLPTARHSQPDSVQPCHGWMASRPCQLCRRRREQWPRGGGGATRVHSSAGATACRCPAAAVIADRSALDNITPFSLPSMEQAGIKREPAVGRGDVRRLPLPPPPHQPRPPPHSILPSYRGCGLSFEAHGKSPLSEREEREGLPAPPTPAWRLDGGRKLTITALRAEFGGGRRPSSRGHKRLPGSCHRNLSTCGWEPINRILPANVTSATLHSVAGGQSLEP